MTLVSCAEITLVIFEIESVLSSKYFKQHFTYTVLIHALDMPSQFKSYLTIENERFVKSTRIC